MPKKFVSRTRRTSSSGRSSNAPPAATPALCTTASSLPPVASSIAAAASRTEVGCVTSSWLTSTSLRTPAASSAASSGPLRPRSRIVANTRQPRRASSTVASSPKPDEVPVIRTVRM
jgi:hypothetical protein